MECLHGLEVPSTLAEACRPDRLALVVYDMQEGILNQIDDRDRVVARVGEVLEIARARGIRTLFTRHITLPVELMGSAQLRMWRTWQQVDRLEEVRSPFPPKRPRPRSRPSSPLPTARRCSTSSRSPHSRARRWS